MFFSPATLPAACSLQVKMTTFSSWQAGQLKTLPDQRHMKVIKFIQQYQEQACKTLGLKGAWVRSYLGKMVPNTKQNYTTIFPHTIIHSSMFQHNVTKQISGADNTDGEKEFRLAWHRHAGHTHTHTHTPQAAPSSGWQ